MCEIVRIAIERGLLPSANKDNLTADAFDDINCPGAGPDSQAVSRLVPGMRGDSGKCYGQKRVEYIPFTPIDKF